MTKKAEVVVPPGRLWPNTPSGQEMQIEVFGATGEFATGKTILGLSIAPGVHPEGHKFAGKPRTLYLDFEKSGATYAGTGCRRVDVPAELAKQHGPNYTAKQAAMWFNSLPSQIELGQYDVTVVDPINDVESGQVDLVRSDPKAHGYTTSQFNNSVPLLMAAMKAHWKRLLMAYSNVCQCFFFTTHLRDQFKGGRPSGKREPRGKETLAELASLYLWLERAADKDGKTPDKPSAIVLKQRLADTQLNETGELEIVNLMPPRIPVATVAEIRRYIAQPPDYNRLKATERVIEKPITEIEIQQAKLATAEAQAEAANAQSGLIERQKELTAIRQAAQVQRPQSPDKTAEVNGDAADKRKTAAKQEKAEAKQEADAMQKKLDTIEANGKELMKGNQVEDRVRQFKELLPASGIDPEKVKAAMAAKGAGRFTEMTAQDQTGLLVVLRKKADERKQKENEIPF